MSDKVFRMGFDIDGVLCSIIPECLSAAQKVGLVPPHITVEDINTDMRIQFNWPSDGYEKVFTNEFTLSLPPNMDVINDIKSWIKEGHYVIFITARPDQEKESTIEWMNKYDLLDGSQGIIQIKSALKYIKAQEHNLEIFVDDYPKVIETMDGVIKYPFLLNGPLNRCHEDKYEWNEIRDKINSLK